MSIKQTLRRVKRLPLTLMFRRWRSKPELQPGYTVLLPSPMDMPFMLRLGLEGLRHIDTSNCLQILVVPDGWGNDGGEGLRKVAAEFDDPRIEIVDLRKIDYAAIRAMRPPGCAATHWMMVVNGILHSRGQYAFLHDADAFFLDPDGLERQYREADQGGWYTYGVEARWDNFFTDQKITVPGTWELMFSTRWARDRSPLDLMPAVRQTDAGEFGFDSMLYAQYVDYDSGKVGVMPRPSDFVHFNGTIFSYRLYRACGGKPICDELFRVLLLSLIESSLDVPSSERACPQVDQLARGLHDPTATVQYRADVNRRGYAEFREMIERLCESPVFRGRRADRIREHLRPFDEFSLYHDGVEIQTALSFGDIREASIGKVSE